MATRHLMHFALLVTTIGMKEVLDSNSFLQLVTESGAALDASGAEEASAGAKPVEEIAAEELGTMEDIMGKELGAVENIVKNIVGKELGVMEKSMGDIVEMKKIELGAVKREQGMTPAGPQEVEGPGSDNESPSPLAPPLTPGAQEEARGATTKGTQMEGHLLDRRVLGGVNRSEPRVLGNRDSSDPWATSTVAALQLASAGPALEGFHYGFTDGTHGYAIPYSNRGGVFRIVARFDLAGFATTEALDLAGTDPALRGFHGGFTDGTYGYALPYHSGVMWSGTVVRFDLAGFATTEALDLAADDTALTGFGSGFTDGTYGYAIGHGNGAGMSGKVARFDLAGFATTEALDIAAADPALKGFIGGFTDGTYGYALPHRKARGTGGMSGKVARFDLAGFATTEALDLAATDPALVGFRGGFTDGTYGYAIPYRAETGPFTGTVARFDLAGFATTEALDLAAADTALKGFQGGFTDGTYGYAIPYQNAAGMNGNVARFDLAGFATTEALDLAATDTALRGFLGGFTDGTYGYAIPYHNGAGYSGKVARFGVIKHSLDTSGQDDQSSVVGDPHVVNVAHARFEIRAEGVHKLVQIPQFIQANSKPDLRVDAKIQHLVSNDCSKSFMTSLSIFGRWTEDAFGLMRISQGSDMPNTTLLINTQSPEEFFTQFPSPGVKPGHSFITFKLRDVSFHVGKHYEGRYGKQKAYLNVRIAGLKKYHDLGGLLGYDDRADAEKLAVNCTAAKPPAAHQSSLIGNGRSVPTITDGGSRIEAE